ncbi:MULTISPECIES: SusC/RagA family TonB-linked outer membrane protein [unclassified Carboxylicivirga]|uniref:SusC/RagA family TonB-linked outer membrane protein n=1 Tax=Carboxylicivirga TaxID=1628153 RepID=UPI003D33B0F9
MKSINKFWLALMLFCFIGINALAQSNNVTVKGVVVDETGEPLPGVNIVLQGTTNGVITDFDGNYKINFESTGKEVLIYSFISFENQIFEIKETGTIENNVTLRSDSEDLDEVVVVAFATVKKENLTGSVSQVKAEVLESRPVAQASQALQGVVPGLNISNDMGGELDGSMNINIRGAGTIGQGSSGNPLVLIDGIEGSLNEINPNDIESISVLKDAAAASIYGSRAPFGVILVTTKKGSGGKTTVNYSNNLRISTPINIPDRMNSLDFAYYLNDLYQNTGLNPVYKEAQIQRITDFQNGDLAFGTQPNQSNTGWLSLYESYGNTDWYDVHLNDISFAQDHNLSVKGGTEKVNYYISGGYLDQEGSFRFSNETFGRKTLSTKIGAQLHEKVTLNLTSRFIRKELDKPTAQDAMFYHNLSRRIPTTALYTPYGDYTQKSLVNQLVDGGRTVDQKDYLYNKAQIKFEPIKNWNIFGEINSRIENHDNTKHIAKVSITQPNRNDEYIPVFEGYVPQIEARQHGIYAITAPGQNYFQIGSRQINYTAFNFYTDYSKSIKEHNFKFLTGVQNELFKSKLSYLGTDNLDSDERPFISQNGEKFVYEAKGEWSNLGIFGRINYNYKQRYLVEVNMRADGASRFPEDERWGFFPSASAGWNMSHESFWKPISHVVGSFKIRGSWGVLGNQNTNSYYPYFQNMSIANGNWVVDGDVPSELPAPAPYSSSITWESIESYNFGFDMGLFNNRLTSTFDLFNRTTSDMIGPAPAKPGSFGATVPKTNNAELVTRGWEFEIGWRDNVTNDFSYDVKVVLSDAKSEVTQYSNPENLLFAGNTQQFYEGMQLGEIWGYETVGIAQSDAQMNEWLVNNQPSFGSQWAAGDIMYRDLNGDNVIDAGAQKLNDSGDMKVIGNSTPRYSFGVNAGFNYKAFDFSLFIQGVGKRDVLLSGGAFYPGINQWQVSPYSDHLDYFRPAGSSLGENMDSYYPRPFIGDKNYKSQTHFLQDASYVRLKNVQIGYSLPQTLLSKVGVSNLRVFVSGENLLTLTNLMLFDPEGLADLINGSGKTYPMSAVYSAGLSLTF